MNRDIWHKADMWLANNDFLSISPKDSVALIQFTALMIIDPSPVIVETDKSSTHGEIGKSSIIAYCTRVKQVRGFKILA